NLALALDALQRPREAEPLLRRALVVREKIFGLDHLQLLPPLLGLAQACAELGKTDEAEAFYQRGAHVAQVQWGADDLRTIQRIALLATFHYEQGDYAKAEERFDEAVAGCERRVAAAPGEEAEEVHLANRLLSLGEVQRAAGEAAKSKATWERSLGILEPLAGISRERDTLAAYATVLLCLERIEEARPWVEKALAEKWAQPDFLELARKHGLMPAAEK
ncbi:MAG: tetratricopeptide repeat protein, partial [Thermoanaerobaculia bacterium]|nr:tetratricopeptide repeat protein [Thermoanaerobaculia bacterium]